MSHTASLGLPTGLEAVVIAYLERQSWYQSSIRERHHGSAAARGERSCGAGPAVVESELLVAGRPGLARVELADTDGRYQVIVGWRDPVDAAVALRGQDAPLLGGLEDTAGPVVAYEALADEELCLTLLNIVTRGEVVAKRARHVSSLISHASLVYDERLFMKCYRVLEPAPRPEVELTLRLDDVGFNHLLAPVALWRVGGYDLAFVREFLPEALEGRALALTSLRDLLATDDDSGDSELACENAGGDLAEEMRRLGETTARLHLCLAEAFGERPGDPRAWAEEVARSAPATPGLSRELGAIQGAGSSIRLHGDYHLRRVMRTDTGWIVAGFGDDPSRAAGRGVVEGSPVEDLADMCFALVDVAREAALSRSDRDPRAVEALASSWVSRNRGAFLEGYVGAAGVAALLPKDPGVLEGMLSIFGQVRAERARRSAVTAGLPSR
jgi:maltokinase